MLTPSDLWKIENFDKLNKNHQRVFRHRIKNKFKRSPKDMTYILLNYEKLRLKPSDFVDIDSLINLIETIESLETLQNM